ncbi:MAG: DUF3291 domain-containing protein [Henriciella sp.]|nr:DUF3291 domain-containing protein [Henriciella sp.]
MQLAQLNVAEALYPMDDPRMDGFTGPIEVINALAERSPGFVWRLEDDSERDGALDLRLPGETDVLVNMSVWDDVDSLYHFVYKTAHAKLIRQREDWFVPMTQAILVLWWVPDGHIPDLHEANERLQHFRANGPTPHAFSFNLPFDEAGQPMTPNFPKKDCA